jgi:hypothetical protein
VSEQLVRKDETIVLPAFVREHFPDSLVIEEMVFEGCKLVGPAVLIPFGSTQLRGNSIPGDLNAFLWEITGTRTNVMGGIGMRDCLIEGCSFEAVGLAGDGDFIQRFRQDLLGP